MQAMHFRVEGQGSQASVNSFEVMVWGKGMVFLSTPKLPKL